jgi:hypothetical protein
VTRRRLAGLVPPLLLTALALASPSFAQNVALPSDATLIDCPNDSGNALLLIFTAPPADDLALGYQINIDGEWLEGAAAVPVADIPTVADLPQCFGWNPENPDRKVLRVDRYSTLAEDGTVTNVDIEKGQDYEVRLVALQGALTAYGPPLRARSDQQIFNVAKLNVLIVSILFAALIMSFIYRARKNPNLFIRRIAGLEAVDEAIGRATEMGKPIFHLNGLDPLSTLSTVAAVNMLARIARKVAVYDSRLMVPSFDPVVMTVAQETVRQAYMEEGRPDAYREEDVFFVTDQQFSYVASVCGMIVREKPAAIFLLGYYYAESLMLAETGASTGAIQIAGTDAQSQLPFFITACDYTLIGEELYAASAYLSREPMLLGSLKGQDVAKAVIMVLLLVGSILATLDLSWLTDLLTPLN